MSKIWMLLGFACGFAGMFAPFMWLVALFCFGIATLAGRAGA